jgi:hypothetical protein
MQLMLDVFAFGDPPPAPPRLEAEWVRGWRRAVAP